ncbi:hypothetical protein F3Y22_tig00110013pilonHSYRG00500 [Hibiscus syriacus]|uniref:Uncharacterized protein n=1 Tax=Hibiscus syriacus TaxID=106335 RepID=A0A6A3BSX0_HIBSY|nr:uncharacterized protein LOC120212312 [Hibiscus syriacus]KAE8718538.1 hypothetical protein F3Y22_tig00110013pilonHSYRG00500 [Hibiscus syriacus]
MFDFGDELTIQSNRVPWLIWIQILVMFLLILILYCFTTTSVSLFELDLSAASAPLSSQSDKMPVFNRTSTLVSTRFQASQVEEKQSIKGEITPGTSKGVIRAEEESVEMEECSGNQNCHHPCHYLKLAFLKCLGLDSLSETSSKTTEQR